MDYRRSAILQVGAFRQVAHVAPGIEKPVSALEGKEIPAPVEAGESAGRLQRQAQRMANQRAEHSAVGHDHQAFAAVPKGELFKTGQNAGEPFAAALATGDDMVWV